MRRYLGYKKAKRRGRKSGLPILIFFSIFLFLIIYSLIKINDRLLPSITSIAQMQVTTRINAAVNDSVSKIINERQLTSSDFYSNASDENGRVNSFSVNTLLINDICNIAAVEISDGLNKIGAEKVVIPLGALLGIDIFSNLGPQYNITILPVGNATVDYASFFESVGINQTNFRVSLLIETNVQIMYPLQSHKVSVSRNVALVNTVITGDVPGMYFSPK